MRQTTYAYSKRLTDLNLSLIQKAEEVKQAVNLAAAYGYFSLLDVYRELGYKPSCSDKWYRKDEEYPPGFIHCIMKEIGIQSRKMSGRANCRRYFRPPGNCGMFVEVI